MRDTILSRMNNGLDILDSMYGNTISMLRSCTVDFEKPPPTPEAIISVNGVPLGSSGNLFCVTGGEGSGKSNFVAAMIAGAIGSNVDTLGLKVSRNSSNKAVLLYDTEQSETQLFKNCTSILRRSNEAQMPDCFKAYSLTGMTRDVRLQSIVESMDRAHHYYGGIHMVVVDGIADLIRGANDETSSVHVVEELYRLAGIYNTCIICVLHFVPSGLKLRGHIGSELQRKAAAIVSIEKESKSEVSVIRATKVRDGSPLDVPMAQFGWDKAFNMHRYIGVKAKEDRESRKDSELCSAAKDIFRNKRSLTYVELCDELQSIFDVKERSAKSYVRYMREKGIITNDENNPTNLIIGKKVW